MEQDMIELIETMKKINFKLIKDGKEVMPVCLLPKGDKLAVIGIPFSSSQEKQMFKIILKKIVAESGVKKYATCFDVKMTINKVGEKFGENTEVKDCLLMTAYTPNDKYMVVYPYENKKILENEKQEINGREEIKDDWDIWGESLAEDNKFIDEYSQFRDDNPEKYGDKK